METELTKQIKADCLQYYRNERNRYIVQECCRKDILMCDKYFNNFYEMEIKVSKADLQREFNKAKHKKPDVSYYYFIVPDYLIENCLIVAKKLNPKYGVLCYEDFTQYRTARKLGQSAGYLERALLNKLSSDYVKWYREIQIYRADRQSYIPDCDGKVHTIFDILLRTYPRKQVEAFQYVAKTQEIYYYKHIISIKKTYYKLDEKIYRYTMEWKEVLVYEVGKWIRSEK